LRATGRIKEGKMLPDTMLIEEREKGKVEMVILGGGREKQGGCRPHFA